MCLKREHFLPKWHPLGQKCFLAWTQSTFCVTMQEWIVCDYEILTEESYGGKMFPRRPFATNAIYHSVTEPHHVMLLQAIYSCVKDGVTFDQCVWPCCTLLPPRLILNLSYEPLSLWGDKGEAHPQRTFSVRQIAVAPEPFKRWYCCCYGCTYSLMADGAKGL